MRSFVSLMIVRSAEHLPYLIITSKYATIYVGRGVHFMTTSANERLFLFIITNINNFIVQIFTTLRCIIGHYFIFFFSFIISSSQ